MAKTKTKTETYIKTKMNRKFRKVDLILTISKLSSCTSFYYDQKTQPRETAIGSEVLVLLPDGQKKLTVKWT